MVVAQTCRHSFLSGSQAGTPGRHSLYRIGRSCQTRQEAGKVEEGKMAISFTKSPLPRQTQILFPPGCVTFPSFSLSLLRILRLHPLHQRFVPAALHQCPMPPFPPPAPRGSLWRFCNRALQTGRRTGEPANKFALWQQLCKRSNRVYVRCGFYLLSLGLILSSNNRRGKG